MSYRSHSQYSRSSKSSVLSKQIFDELKHQNATKIYSLQGSIGEKMLQECWSSFGAYLSRQLRMGRAVVIPQFGSFTFTAPQVRLAGVTNPQKRDKLPRNPVFIVSKYFVHGKRLNSGIFYQNTLRPYCSRIPIGAVSQTKINYTEIGAIAGVTKDIAQMSVKRIAANLAKRIRGGEIVYFDIPHVGLFVTKNNVVGVQFHDFLIADTKTIHSKSLKQRRQMNNFMLTKSNLQSLAYQSQQGRPQTGQSKGSDGVSVTSSQLNTGIQIDDGARNYLRTTLNINDDVLKSLNISRPTTAMVPSKKSQREDRDETFSAFNDIGERISRRGNGRLKPWQKFAMTAKQNGRQRNPEDVMKQTLFNEPQTELTAEYAFKKLTTWMRSKNLGSEKSFHEVCSMIYGAAAPKASKLNFDQFNTALLKLGFIFPREQGKALFDLLDMNHDGILDLMDWKGQMPELGMTGALSKIKDIIFKKNLKADDVLKRMNYSREQAALNRDQLAAGFEKLSFNLNHDKSLVLADSLLKNRRFLPVSELLTLLQCIDDSPTEDTSWMNTMLRRVKIKLAGKSDPNMLHDIFEKFDANQTGVLSVPNFKTCFLQADLGFSMTELSRLSRYLEKQNKDKINYAKFLKLVDDVFYDKHKQDDLSRCGAHASPACCPIGP